MTELIMGLFVLACSAAAFFFGAWSREKDKRSEAEEKVRAHEILQRVESDIANGGDEYVTRILRENSRTVRSDKASDDI